VSALLALLLFVASLGAAVYTATRTFPRGLIAAVLLALAVDVAWQALRRLGMGRLLFAVLGILLVAAGSVVLNGPALAGAALAVALLALATVAGRDAFRVHVALPPAPRPRHPVVVWNPRSGDGKALAAHLDDEARARGIEPIELHPGDDLVQLVLDALARGADAVAAAGGDGTQALIAGIASAHDVPFACIPAGTRNHFALDLGVDRDDVVGALDAFVCGGERRVDLAEVNGRVFVNNASLGVYAEAVQQPQYRDHKLRTLMATVPDVAGPGPGREQKLRYRAEAAARPGQPIVIQVSNNAYRLGKLVGSGTRPRLDGGRLGIVVLAQPPGRGPEHLSWQQWEAEAFEVDADGPVASGIDGEALVLEPPLRFRARPGALRVRLAPQHPGASPSAGLPDNLVAAVGRLIRIVLTGQPSNQRSSGPSGQPSRASVDARLGPLAIGDGGPGQRVAWGHEEAAHPRHSRSTRLRRGQEAPRRLRSQPHRLPVAGQFG
jgi:diacylglycerol kinase family enzyme